MRMLRPAIGLTILLLTWQWFSQSGNILLPSLANIVFELAHQLSRGTLLADLLASTLRVVTGVLISTVAAWALGLISVYWKMFPSYLKGAFEMLRPIPPIAWTPVAIIAFGIGDGPAVAIVALGSFFPIWYGVTLGLREVKQYHLRAAYSLGCGKWLLLTDIIVPSVLPYAVHGLRLGAGLGWFCVVAAEMMGASSGLGYGVQLYSMNIEMEKLYTYLATIGAVGYLSNSILERIDKRTGRYIER